MSERQIYEFRRLDGALCAEQRDELRAISTRATITSTHFRNEYDRGSLGADPTELMESYFDAHFYISDWLTRRLIFRFPADIVSIERLAPYCDVSCISTWSAGEFTLLDLHLSDEPANYNFPSRQHEKALEDLVELRMQLMAGDMRCVYLLWLHYRLMELRNSSTVVEEEEADRAEVEVPVPAGLGQIEGRGLARFIEVFEIAPEVIEAAARHSEPRGLRADRREEVERFIREMPEIDKEDLLLRVARHEEGIGLEIMARFREQTMEGSAPPGGEGTSVSQLFEEASELRAEGLLRAQQRREREREERERQRRERREEYLEDLSRRWEKSWEEVDEFIERKTRRHYRKAARLMGDLLEAASTGGRADEAHGVVQHYRDTYPGHRALMEEMDEAGLPLRQDPHT